MFIVSQLHDLLDLQPRNAFKKLASLMNLCIFDIAIVYRIDTAENHRDLLSR